MKCSTYLWNYFTMNKEHPEYSNAQVQGELRLLLGDEKIVSDTDGAELSERDALSIYGRNDEMLREAFNLGSKKLFELVVTNQQMSDDEWHKAKEEAQNAEEVDPGFSVDPGTGGEDEDQAEAAGETE